MACPWWDDDEFGGRLRHEKDQKGKRNIEKEKGQSHEDQKGKNIHEGDKRDDDDQHKAWNPSSGKMKEQKQPAEKSYDRYNTGYVKGYEHGYEDGYGNGYAQGCENTMGSYEFGNGHSGQVESGKKIEYVYHSGYSTVKSSEYVEYHHGYDDDLGHGHSSDNEYGSNDVSDYENDFGCDYGGGWDDSD